MARAPVLAATFLLSTLAAADAPARRLEIQPRPPQPFSLLGQPVVGDRLSGPAPVGSTIALWGGGAIVVDADTGELVAVDGAGNPVARTRIGRDAGQLVLSADRATAFVADRAGDRVVVVALPELKVARSFATRAEPWGLALAPGGKTILVTAVADRSVTAYDTATGVERWTVPLGAEPRGVAVSPDGRRALVTYLTQGVVARLDLTHERPTLGFVTLGSQGPSSGGRVVSDPEIGRGQARAAYAVAFIRDQVAVVPHQMSTPHQQGSESRGTYGGNASQAPVAHRIDFIDVGGEPAQDRLVTAQLGLHQPRAIAYDAATDVLYAAGYGADQVSAIAGVSTRAPKLAWSAPLPRCAPTGIAAGDGVVRVYCETAHAVVTISGEPRAVVIGAPVARSQLPLAAQRGRDLFRLSTTQTSARGSLACSSCHPDARADGLSWRIEGRRLQTPVLAGRLVDTEPYKWDGKDPTLATSVKHTIERLGGTGLGPNQVSDLVAYLTSLPAPRGAAPRDGQAAARGKQLFAGAGCAGCHGGPRLTVGTQHRFQSNLAEADTPSLIGLGASAPYFHDGSAPTLRAVLLDNGRVHGMSPRTLSGADLDDLVTFLETL